MIGIWTHEQGKALHLLLYNKSGIRKSPEEVCKFFNSFFLVFGHNNPEWIVIVLNDIWDTHEFVLLITETG